MKRALFAPLLAIVLGGCWPGGGDEAFNGYAEADLVHVAAEETARIVSLDVRRGDEVSEGQALFRLDEADAAAALAEAEAQLSRAEAELADLESGQRPEEIAVMEARRDQIEADLAAAQRDYARRETLHGQRVVSDAVIDETQARFLTLQAQLRQVEREIDVARLPARENARRAAKAGVSAARAAVERAEVRKRRLTGVAPVGARVENTFFEAGETPVAGQPLVSLLRPDAIRVRFFVPGPRLSGIGVGSRVRVGCDGCEETEATVTFVAGEAEFTPPVIYSVGARDKLVYMVEAAPDTSNTLKPGQPVDVRPAP